LDAVNLGEVRGELLDKVVYFVNCRKSIWEMIAGIDAGIQNELIYHAVRIMKNEQFYFVQQSL